MHNPNPRYIGVATGEVCYLCGRMILWDQSSIDHILPQYLGGTNSKNNLALTCMECNNNKDKSLLPQHLSFLFYKNNYIPKDVEDFYVYYIKHNVLTHKPVDHGEITNSLVAYYQAYQSLHFYRPDNTEYSTNLDQINLDFLEKYKTLPDSLKIDMLSSQQINTSSAGKKVSAKKKAVKDWLLNNKPIGCFMCSSTINLTWSLILPGSFLGKISAANYAIKCESCQVEDSNKQELTKFKINYLIQHHLFDKNLYPTNQEQVLRFLVDYNICSNPELVQSDKNKKRLDDLNNQLSNLYESS